MRTSHLPISSLPAFAKFNDIIFENIAVEKNEEYGGYGLAATTILDSIEEDSCPTLLKVPKDLILCAETIDEHSKVDKHFRELRKVAGHNTLRGDIMLFLLMQITMASPKSSGNNIGVSSPWTEYVKMLPECVPLPTTWNEEQMQLLTGTSLEAAVSAKMGALLREFESLRENTIEIPWCHKAWWNSDSLHFKDWILIDSWFRSRSLDLPLSGEAMVPCLDMANHAVKANSHYEQAHNADVLLMLKPEQKVEVGEELSIDYGSAKSAAEMLFSYGFIDDSSPVASLVLHIRPFPDDPLGKAKVVMYGKPPMLRVSASDDSFELSCPFIYLMCVGEDDGLSFKTLQETDGTFGAPRVFWKDADVTDSTDSFEDVISADPLRDVFILRAMVLLKYIVEDQMESLSASEHMANELLANLDGPTVDIQSIHRAASKLRVIEAGLLRKCLEWLESEIYRLSLSPAVSEYLGRAEPVPPPEPAAVDEEDAESADFS